MATAVHNIKIEADDKDVWEIISDGASTVNLEDAMPADREDPVAPELPSNPIGELQELCVSRGWALPEYEDGPRTGPPHLPTFVVTCTLNELSYSANATSKKTAKKTAAAGMLETVKRENPSGARPRPSLSKNLFEIENTLNQLSITADENFLESMSAANVEKLLSTLAQRSDVVLTSRAGSDIEGRSIWICELDGHTITGYGKTPQEARMDAAKGVLHRLRMKLSNQ